MAKMSAMPVCGYTFNSREEKGQNDNHWMTFDFFTERLNTRGDQKLRGPSL